MKLYIVGNGFDLNHGRKTSYWDYRNHLLEKYPDLVNKFDTMEHTTPILLPSGECLAVVVYIR